MRRIISLACLLACVWIAAAALTLRSMLPLNTHPLIAKKYTGWSGVLRIWANEDAESYNAWMNRRIAAFEKSHEGVYIQIRYVSSGAFETLNDSGIRPPDMVLFGHDAQTFSCTPLIYENFSWALNRETVPRIPQDWTGLRVGRLPDGEHDWSSAMAGLCSGLFPIVGEEIALPDVDLGLTGASSESEESHFESAPCIMTNDLTIADDIVAQFARGELDAIVISDAEAAQLNRLSEKGKCVEWVRAESGAQPYREVSLQIGLIDAADVWATQRRALCNEFLNLLQSEFES